MGINRTKLLDRKHDRRDARLFIIATEGAVTEQQYFEMFDSSRIKVKVLPTGSDNQSAPDYVLDRLNSFTEEFDLHEDDMLWLVLDVDRWGDEKLSFVCREAKQKNYNLAISNPCFEVWLCIHFDDLDSEDKTCKQFKARLRKILGSYKSSNLDLPKYAPNLAEAVERAKILHPDLQQNWPPTIGTHVYRLVELLIQLSV
ncbi:RloB family protein [Chamaesiphon sp. VAR_69_metabat_338]|uniref:RloB family protein n=1 Tax=Chamaesiphon sp. VAR_69_metabat_338 TaxID=2964704 RepID=UPI00286D8EF3|nr:RloB family protein [Chamaesiphon sp. VAR_69_metabat_338]